MKLKFFHQQALNEIDVLLLFFFQNCKGKYQRAILYVSGDALRVVDEISKVKQVN